MERADRTIQRQPESYCSVKLAMVAVTYLSDRHGQRTNRNFGVIGLGWRIGFTLLAPCWPLAISSLQTYGLTPLSLCARLGWFIAFALPLLEEWLPPGQCSSDIAFALWIYLVACLDRRTCTCKNMELYMACATRRHRLAYWGLQEQPSRERHQPGRGGFALTIMFSTSLT